MKYSSPTWQLDFRLTGSAAAAFPYGSAGGRTSFTLTGKQLRTYGRGGARAGDVREGYGEVWYDDQHPPRYSDSGTFWNFRLTVVRGDGTTEQISDGFYMLAQDGRSIASVLSRVNWALTDGIRGRLRVR